MQYREVRSFSPEAGHKHRWHSLSPRNFKRYFAKYELKCNPEIPQIKAIYLSDMNIQCA
jgi:hypothetical protein